MNYLPRLSGVLLALLWFSGCGTTVTLKSGSQPPRVAKAEPAENGSGAGVSSKQGKQGRQGGQGGAEASVRSSEESPEGKVASNAGAASAKAVITFRDRFASGLRTGTVGAAFGGLGGPVGFAAGGGTGFLAGFLVGRPLFGGGAPLADNQSWERQVENQKTWEEQVASHVEQLDGQPPASAGANAIVPPASGIGSTDAGVGVASLPAPSQDPIGDFDAWEEQIIAHAEPMITRGDSPAAVESSAPTAGLPGMPSPEGVPPGEAAWSARETKTTVHALDVDEDGRLDDDGDGRFETLPASPPVLPKEQIDTPGSGP